ncbi:MAG TPA: ATP-binding protein [Rhizomicrobium sp.]|jgi:PAS domain S-box-containing protein
MQQHSGRTETLVSESGWQHLVDAVERLAAAEKLTDVIAIVRESARAISGADGVTFVMRDRESCHYVDENAIGPLWKGQRFPLTACISGWCMLNDRSAIIPDIYVDARIPHDAYRPTFVKSLIMVPVRAPEPIAAIGSYWSSPRDFLDSEVALIEALARAASTAIAACHMRAQIRESEQRLSLALAAGGLSAWDIDLAAGRLAFSEGGEAVFGLPPAAQHDHEELIEALHIDDRENYIDAFDRAVRTRAPLALELRISRRGGDLRWIEMRGRPDLDINGRPRRVAGVCRDITERKTNALRLERLQAEIAQVGRLSEMGEMAATLSHELSQPLAAARNFLSAARRLLSNPELPPEKGMDAIRHAEEQFVRVNEIVRRVRGFLQQTECERKAENLDDVIGEACALARMDSRHRSVEVEVDIATNLPPVRVDRVQIQQVLLNLLRNAFEATEGLPRRQVTVSARPGEPGAVEVDVCDTGPGLGAEALRDLFKPFVTTKSGGMGLGLSLSRSIVEAHEGTMQGFARPEGGALFRFTLPVAG